MTSMQRTPWKRMLPSGSGRIWLGLSTAAILGAGGLIASNATRSANGADPFGKSVQLAQNDQDAPPPRREEGPPDRPRGDRPPRDDFGPRGEDERGPGRRPGPPGDDGERRGPPPDGDILHDLMHEIRALRHELAELREEVRALRGERGPGRGERAGGPPRDGDFGPGGRGPRDEAGGPPRERRDGPPRGEGFGPGGRGPGPEGRGPRGPGGPDGRRGPPNGERRGGPPPGDGPPPGEGRPGERPQRPAEEEPARKPPTADF